MNKNENITPYFSYPEIRDRLSTFTIINCEHRNLFLRWIGHTAVVYRCQETGQLMVFESKKFTGVALTPMGKWVSEYPGKVFVRIPEFTYKIPSCDDFNYLTKNTVFENRLKNAEEFVKNHIGSSYPDLQTWSGKMKLILAALDLKICGKDIFTYTGNDKGIFCTMLVVMFLQYCGLMDDVITAQEVEPDDLRANLTWLKLMNCKYGVEIRIK